MSQIFFNERKNKSKDKNIKEKRMGCYLLTPSLCPLLSGRGIKGEGVCKEANGIRFIPRSLHCSVGGGGVSNLTKNERRNDKKLDSPLYVIPDLIRNLVFYVVPIPNVG